VKQPVAGEHARQEGEAEDHRQADHERQDTIAEQRDAERRDDEKPNADRDDLGEVVAGEHAALGNRRRMATDVGAQGARQALVAERRQLAGRRLDRLAVAGCERVLEAAAQRHHVRLTLGIGVAGDRIERCDPIGGHRGDLAVGGPAEARNHVAQVHDLPVEQHEDAGDDQEAEDNGDPILRLPPSRHRRRGTEVGGRGPADSGCIGHDALLITRRGRRR
jgi:hypothetical protein